MNKAYPHSNVFSSDLSIFLNRESLNALMRAYSASPSCKGSASKLPMHPRSLGARPGRDERVFHVTNRGLQPYVNTLLAASEQLTIYYLGILVGSALLQV